MWRAPVSSTSCCVAWGTELEPWSATLAPASASAIAMPAPRPRDEPVTSAVLPFRLNLSSIRGIDPFRLGLGCLNADRFLKASNQQGAVQRRLAMAPIYRISNHKDTAVKRVAQPRCGGCGGPETWTCGRYVPSLRCISGAIFLARRGRIPPVPDGGGAGCFSPGKHGRSRHLSRARQATIPAEQGLRSIGAVVPARETRRRAGRLGS